MPRKKSRTKLEKVMRRNKMRQVDLLEAINRKHPETPMSKDSLSLIVSGKRSDYKLSTLYRICGALETTPDKILDYESKVK